MATGAKRKSQDTPSSQSSPETRSQPSGQSQVYPESELNVDRELPYETSGPSRSRGRRYGEDYAMGRTGPRKLARALGWFSIGLAVAEILMPRRLARFIGVRRSNAGLIRLFGFRELGSGIWIFASRRSAGPVWSRVAGDALDLATLGAAFASTATSKGRLAFATANVAAVSALDVVCARQLSTGNGAARSASTALKSIIINRSPEDLYQSWRQVENLPRFLRNLESVQSTGQSHSHWVASAPAGAKIEWDAEITLDRPNERIEWHSLSGSDIQNYGSIYFERAPGDRGTIVHLELHYSLPGGKFGSALARLFGHDPGQRAMQALRRFKQIMEAGEIAVSDATIYGAGLFNQRPAQPVGDPQQQTEWSRSAGRTGQRTAPTRQSMQRMEDGYAS